MVTVLAGSVVGVVHVALHGMLLMLLLTVLMILLLLMLFNSCSLIATGEPTPDKMRK